MRTVLLGRKAATIAVEGELDLGSSAGLREELRALGPEVGHVLVDLTAVTFVDSAALTVLAVSARRLRGRGGELLVAVDDASILSVLRIAGLDRYLTVYDSEDAAMRYLVGLSLLESLEETA
jgi:anti-sigma B factor antagonist